MKKLLRLGQILGGGLWCAFCGALVAGVAGCLAFGLVNYLVLMCMGGRQGSAMLTPYNIGFGFRVGLVTGLMTGSLAWFFPGLLRTARRFAFPWRRIIYRTAFGAMLGVCLSALNCGLVLVYAAKTRVSPSPWGEMQFLGTGPLPGRIGPFIPHELPLFTMVAGLLLGILLGAWWGTRQPQGKKEAILPLGDRPEAEQPERGQIRQFAKGTQC